MSLDEAIEHIDEIINKGDMCEECKLEHLQLKNWLIELKQYRNAEVD